MDDLIRRSDAIRIASGYCHWSNIPAELAKLPSVNPIPCEDAISRQAVLDTLKEMMQPCGDGLSIYDQGNFIHNETLSDVNQTVEALPSVSTEKTGRWEWNQYDYNPNLGNWHCSECGSIVIECVPKKDPNGVPLYKYCPQCGCRLVEPQESDNCN